MSTISSLFHPGMDQFHDVLTDAIIAIIIAGVAKSLQTASLIKPSNPSGSAPKAIVHARVGRLFFESAWSPWQCVSSTPFLYL